MRMAEFEKKAEMHRQTIYRYERAGLITFKRNGSDRVFTEDDLDRVWAVADQIKQGMVVKVRLATTERIAAERLNGGRRPKATAALIRERVAAIIAEVPAAERDDFLLLTAYYGDYHGTTSLHSLRTQGAPTPETLGRRRREILAERRLTTG